VFAVFGQYRFRVKSNAGLPRDTLAKCHYKRRTIYIPIDGDTLAELDWILHEAVHAACPWMDEWAVDKLARHLARFLWRLGWRRHDDPA